MVLSKMSRFCLSKKTDEDLQSTKNTNFLPQKIQTQIILLLKNRHVRIALDRLVDFPVNGLDMSQFVCNPDIPNDYFKDEAVKMEVEHGSILYDLIGISNHFGSTGGGHYTAYCKYFMCDLGTRRVRNGMISMTQAFVS